MGGGRMAQLIKIQDYISRYEQDIYRYPSQFAKLKKQQWDKLQAAYHAGELDQLFSQPDEEQTLYKTDTTEEETKGLFRKVKGLFNKSDYHDEEVQIPNPAKIGRAHD